MHVTVMCYHDTKLVSCLAHAVFCIPFFRAENENMSLLEVCSPDKTSDRDDSFTFSSETKYVKKGRENSAEEKRKMRNSRKKRLRQLSVSRRDSKMKIKRLKEEKEQALKKAENSESKVLTLKCMVRTFWERWRWEVEKRKEALFASTRVGYQMRPKNNNIQEIQPDHLVPLNETSHDHFVGRGSFGVVSVKMFHGMQVAVKTLHIRSLLEDVQQEATILAQLCHPFLPYLFGICTGAKPFRIVMQFHGFNFDPSTPESITLLHELNHNRVGLNDTNWIIVIAQLLEVIKYLHTKAEILHNDISSRNIVLGNSIEKGTSTTRTYQIVLVDFGKATKLTQGRMYHLNRHEKDEYQRKFPQLAPEVIEGDCRQCTHSDMYAVGGIIYQIADRKCAAYRKVLWHIAENCRLVNYRHRFSASVALQYLQDNVAL